MNEPEFTRYCCDRLMKLERHYQDGNELVIAAAL